MSAGLQIINDYGVLQVDEGFKNLEFKEKRIISIPGGGLSVVMETPGYRTEVIAIGPSDEPNWNSAYGILSKQGGLGRMRYELTSGIASDSANVELYIFGEPDVSAGHDGLAVYDAAGEIVFNAARKYMKVVEQFRFGDRTDNIIFRFGLPYKPAVVLSHTRIRGYRYSVIPDRPVIAFDMVGIYGSEAGGWICFAGNYQSNWAWGNGLTLPLDCPVWIQPVGGFVIFLDVSGL